MLILAADTERVEAAPGLEPIHDLADVLFVALAATLCGATSEAGIAWFAQDRLELLRPFVPLANGAPSQDDFSQVFRRLDPKAFEAALRQLMTAFGRETREKDAPNLRRAYEAARVHMPCPSIAARNASAAWARGNLAVLKRVSHKALRADPEKIPLTHKKARANWSREGLLRALRYMS